MNVHLLLVEVHPVHGLDECLLYLGLEKGEDFGGVSRRKDNHGPA